jgi:hypothetical protein
VRRIPRGNDEQAGKNPRRTVWNGLISVSVIKTVPPVHAPHAVLGENVGLNDDDNEAELSVLSSGAFGNILFPLIVRSTYNGLSHRQTRPCPRSASVNPWTAYGSPMRRTAAERR